VKIVLISNYRIGSEAGTAKVAERLADHFSQKNRVLYLCLGETYKKTRVNKNLDYLKIPSMAIKQGYAVNLTPNIVNKIFSDLDAFKPSIVHAQNIFFVSLIALVWAKKNKVPFIITLHSLPDEGIAYVYPKLSNNHLIKVFNHTLSVSYIREFLNSTDTVIALNEAIEKSIKNTGTTTPIKIVNNGIPLKPFLKLKIKKTKREKIFLFLGSYMERKNQLFLVRAFKYLPDNYKLILHGNIQTGTDYVNKLRKTTKKENINNVEINEFLTFKGVLKSLEKADYFVSASVKEVQSLVIIEALASGTPVIGLKNETIEEVVDGKNGLPLPNSVSH
jgi:1,2-diacylglycerol 3-alpha-glucosyltransferase